MFRRWQWNFCKPAPPHCTRFTGSDRVISVRLESEHLGNVDQYRVTRQIPLPYTFDPPAHDSDGEDGDEDRWYSKGLVKQAFIRLQYVRSKAGRVPSG